MVCQIADELRMTTDMPTDCADCVYAPTCQVNTELERLKEVCRVQAMLLSITNNIAPA